ncbi:hypothetical protein NDU88_003503 [Pleurodeles waltl]|uniref:Uncharacterized protein n=1 Tax=Pleurodeles waltl TaxID=8319 RepID=A0AAV7W2D8_PLEWA|nr:hypothetical protein NDU88_003503 [Pleurodeles waltl]
MLHKVGRCSGDQPAKFGATWENRQEVRERFRATIPTAGEQQSTSEVQKKNVDWKNFDGGVGDGEHPGTSFGYDDTEVCELDYDEESEALEEGEIPEERNKGDRQDRFEQKGGRGDAKYLSTGCILQVSKEAEQSRKNQGLKKTRGRNDGCNLAMDAKNKLNTGETQWWCSWGGAE